jgi:Flp pilus assembly protein TadB
MTTSSTGWDHTILVHLDRLRSPLGVTVLAAAFSLLLALLLIRRRHRVNDPTKARERMAVLRTYPSASTRRQATADRGDAPKSLRGRAVESLRRRRPADLSEVLAPYQLTPLEGQEAPADVWTLITLPVLKKFSVTLENLVSESRAGRWLNNMIERSGARTRLGELLVIWLIGSLAFVLLAWVLAGLLGIFISLIVSCLIPPAALQAAVDRRAKLFASQLPDVLKLTASSLRAGFSLLQGLEAVTKQLRDPSASELQRVLAEARLGRPVEDALEEAAARIRNRDFSESVAAVRIQQEAGGNLAGLFDTLADTMVQRLRLRREVQTLTAEGRLSAYILGCLPIALGIFIFAINRSYMQVLFQTVVGKALLIGSLLLQVLGFYWMYRIVNIET